MYRGNWIITAKILRPTAYGQQVMHRRLLCTILYTVDCDHCKTVNKYYRMSVKMLHSLVLSGIQNVRSKVPLIKKVWIGTSLYFFSVYLYLSDATLDTRVNGSKAVLSWMILFRWITTKSVRLRTSDFTLMVAFKPISIPFSWNWMCRFRKERKMLKINNFHHLYRVYTRRHWL